MKILITGTTGDSMPPPYGGIPKVSLLYGRTWRKMGSEVAITFVYKPENADDFDANAKYFFEYSSKPDKFKKLFFLIHYFLKNPFLYVSLFKKYVSIYPKINLEIILYSAYGVYIDEVIYLFKPDLILSETALIKTFMVACVAKKNKIPLVIDTYAEVHDQSIGVNRYLSVNDQKKYWVNFLDMAELVLGISNCTRGAQKYLPNNKVREFYDTCDFTLARMDNYETKSELRKYFNIPENRFIASMVGAFEFRKGHDHLIKVVSELSKKGYDIGGAICGGSGDKTKWELLAKKEGVSDRIYFFSRLSEIDLIKFHRMSNVYCNLSNSNRSCGLDLALLEAMASGLPIVVYNNGALPTAIHNDKNGYVVNTNDLNMVADVLVKLYKKSDKEREEMGQVSKTIAEKCDINLTAEIKLNWFKEVIRNYK